MARTKKQEIQRRYNLKEEALKAEYLAETGKKIARGFKETEGYKRNEKNRKNALFRYERRKDQTKAEGAARVLDRELKDETKVVTDREFKGTAKGIGKFEADLVVANELFFTALDSGGGVLSAVFDMKEAQASGIQKRIVGVVRDYDGKEKTYNDPFYFEKAILNLLKAGEDLQNKSVTIGSKTIKNRDRKNGKGTVYYPMVNYAIFETNDEIFYTVTGEFDEADFEAAAQNVVNLSQSP